MIETNGLPTLARIPIGWIRSVISANLANVAAFAFNDDNLDRRRWVQCWLAASRIERLLKCFGRQDRISRSPSSRSRQTCNSRIGLGRVCPLNR